MKNELKFLGTNYFLILESLRLNTVACWENIMSEVESSIVRGVLEKSQQTQVVVMFDPFRPGWSRSAISQRQEYENKEIMYSTSYSSGRSSMRLFVWWIRAGRDSYRLHIRNAGGRRHGVTNNEKITMNDGLVNVSSIEAHISWSKVT